MTVPRYISVNVDYGGPFRWDWSVTATDDAGVHSVVGRARTRRRANEKAELFAATLSNYST